MGIRYTEEQAEEIIKRLAGRKDRVVPDPHLEPKSAATRKYHNRPTGGYASKKEALRAQELRLEAQAGTIADLEEQVPYVVIPKQVGPDGKLQERQCVYVADFRYRRNGEIVVEDVKSPASRTAEYIIKRKLMLLVHNLRILET